MHHSITTAARTAVTRLKTILNSSTQGWYAAHEVFATFNTEKNANAILYSEMAF